MSNILNSNKISYKEMSFPNINKLLYFLCFLNLNFKSHFSKGTNAINPLDGF